MSTYGLWLSAAGMKVQEHRQTLLANNLANAESTGFKHDLARVTQRKPESAVGPQGARFAHPVLDRLPGGPNVAAPYHDLTQAALVPTGRDLDVALQGDGFLEVSDGRRTRYSRDGGLAVSPSGELVLAAGGGRWKVLNEDHQTISVDTSLGNVEVFADGTVRQGEAVVARLAAMKAANPRALQKTGENLFDASRTGMQPANPRWVPGSLEQSNVDVMAGLTQMIEAGRIYEMNANMVRIQDQATGELISRAGQIV